MNLIDQFFILISIFRPQALQTWPTICSILHSSEVTALLIFAGFILPLIFSHLHCVEGTRLPHVGHPKIVFYLPNEEIKNYLLGFSSMAEFV